MNNYILITGASRGIGKAIALKFARHGHNIVILSSKSEDSLENVKKDILSYHVDCKSFTVDVSDFSQIQTMKNSLAGYDIDIDCIINNAGISYFGLIQDMSIEDWHKTIDTNLSSVFYTTKVFLDDMIRKGSGCIINISSVFGIIGASCEVAYSASKGGLNAFTKALAKEVAPSNIRVNSISCGAIHTSMNGRLSSDEISELENEIPFGRMGTCEEVAELAYSIFHMNPYMTGQVISIDGGWT